MGYAKQEVQQVQHTEQHEDNGIAHELVHEAGDILGYWPLLGFLIIGVAVTLRKKIKTILKDWLK